MDKSPDAFRTISEAAEELDLPQHVLRFWETRFSSIKPLKRGGGRRFYRPEDVLLLKGIRHLLYDRGFTIKGVQRILKDQGPRYVIGVAEGRPIEDLPLAPEVEEPDSIEEMAQPALAAPEPMTDEASEPVANAPSRSLFGLRAPNKGLDARDREKLNDVLRELLEAKRLLDRARDT